MSSKLIKFDMMKRSLNYVFGLVLAAVLALPVIAATSKEEAYIKKYSKIAMSEMRRSGVPASITLAQGLLESGAGLSRLAVEANNHFGIKCHKWTGKTIRHDDDAPQECFRAYDKAEESYRDHSDFLRYSDRYKSLFDLPVTDYKSWAYGLKKAGYATDPAYADKLINIIEKYNLGSYDRGHVVVDTPLQLEEPREIRAQFGESFEFSMDRKTYEKNGVRFVYSQSGETYQSIALSFDLFTKEILRFNDLKESRELLPGTVVYIAKKKSKTEKGLDKYIVAEDGESLWEICQRFGVTVKAVQKRNKFAKDHFLAKDEEIRLR